MLTAPLLGGEDRFPGGVEMRWISLLLVVALVAACDDSTPSLLPDGPPVKDLGPEMHSPPREMAVPDGPPSVDLPRPDMPSPDLPGVDMVQLDLGPPDTVGWDIMTTAGKDYVVSRLIMPTSTTSSQLGVDLNNDGTVDNALGAILGAIGAMATSMDIQESMDMSVYSGALLQLMRVFSNSLVTDPGAVLQSWAGQAQSCCTALTSNACWAQSSQTCFNGSHGFSPDPASPTGTLLTGTILGGNIAFTASTMKLNLPLTTAGILSLNLKAVHIKGVISAGGITSGIIAGAIPKWDVDNVVIPAVATQLDQYIKDPSSDPMTVLTIKVMFDANSDGNITTQEVANSALIKTFLGGDVDVDNDGVNELSVGLGFTGVGAVITP